MGNTETPRNLIGLHEKSKDGFKKKISPTKIKPVAFRVSLTEKLGRVAC